MGRRVHSSSGEVGRHGTPLYDHPLWPRISNSIVTWRTACRGTRWSQ